MPEKTLVEVFGAGSSQSATELIISKTGLASILAPNYSFSPTANNSVDELLAAIVCSCLMNLSPEDRAEDPLTRNLQFSYDPTINFSVVNVNGQSFNQHIIELAFFKAITTPKLNPSDFV
jgi:hypothetical protein